MPEAKLSKRLDHYGGPSMSTHEHWSMMGEVPSALEALVIYRATLVVNASLEHHQW